jgi:vacuolar-type H+-ATPase subunit H
MREDMRYINGVLDEMDAVVQDASNVPMRKGRAVVDRSELLVLLDELKGSLPREMIEAENLRRECGAMISAAEEEAARIIENAHARAEARVEDTELYRRALRRADEAVDRAERYAEEVTSGSEVYRDRVMDQLQNWFEDSILSVGESRQELSGTVVRRPARTETEESESEDSEERRDWRKANSA